MLEMSYKQICLMSYKIGCSNNREQIIQLGSADLMPPNALSSETSDNFIRLQIFTYYGTLMKQKLATK